MLDKEEYDLRKKAMTAKRIAILFDSLSYADTRLQWQRSLSECFAAAFYALYDSGVSYRKGRIFAYRLFREMEKNFPKEVQVPLSALIDSAILNAENRFSKSKKKS